MPMYFWYYIVIGLRCRTVCLFGGMARSAKDTASVHLGCMHCHKQSTRQARSFDLGEGHVSLGWYFLRYCYYSAQERLELRLCSKEAAM